MIHTEEILQDRGLVLTQRLDETDLSNVWRGRIGEIGVVAKLPRYSVYPQEQVEEIFSNEHEIATMLSGHVGLPKYYGARSNGDFSYGLVYEFVEGTNLLDRIRDYEQPKLSLDEIFAYMHDVSTVLEYIASRGLVYRDLKPNNVIIRKPGDHAVVIDLGSARKFNGVGVYHGDCVEGDLEYVSPQSWENYEYSERTDARALAVLFYEMLFRQLPFNIERQVNPIESGREQIKMAQKILAETQPEVTWREEFSDELFYSCREFFAKGFKGEFQNLLHLMEKLGKLEQLYHESNPHPIPSAAMTAS